MTLKKYEKSSKKKSGVSLESSPKPGEKSLKNGHIQRTCWDIFFFLGQKKSGPSPFAPEISWVAFAPSEPVAPKRLVGIHCSVIEMGTAWDFAHCLTVEVPNSMHPGGEKPAFRSERSAATTTKHTVQQAKTSAQGWGNWQHGADLKLSSFNWSWLYLQEWIFLPTRPSLMMSSMMFANYGKMPVWMFHREKARRLPVLFRWNWILSDLHEES